MSASAKLGAYAVALALVLAGGVGVGAAVGPLDGGAAPTQPMSDGTPMAEEGADLPGGLSASDAGFTFAPGDTTFSPGVVEPFTFRIVGPSGTAVTDFDTRHDKELHLVVVSDDLADYQHLHPTRSPDGTWSTTLALPHAGGYRAYADFAVTGHDPVTLGADLVAGGELAPQPLPSPTSSATVDGYEVRLEGSVSAGAESELHFTVRHEGQPVRDLEPYLGAFGHLVAIRATDHGYLHVHPTEASGSEEVAFALHVPSSGAYRLFLDFQHDGVVRTAAFTLDVAAGTANGSVARKEVGHGGD